MTRARRLTPWNLVALAALARLLLPVHPRTVAAEPPEARTSTAAGTVEGVVKYRPDPKRPWRFARYYVHESALAEAVVALEPSAGVALPPPAAAKTWTIDQLNYQFVPETLAIRAGDLVRISNSDEALHNVMTSDGGKPFNVNVARGQDFTHTFESAGGLKDPVRLGCVFHGGMRAWIYVFDHPWFQVTPTNGRFRFEQVPPGRYSIALVHPAGKLRWHKTIEVKAIEPLPVEIALSPDDEIVKPPEN